MIRMSSLPRKVHLFIFSCLLILSAPCLAADKTLVLLPFVLHADPAKSYLGPGLHSMFVSRLSGEGIEVLRDEALTPLLREDERQGIDSRERAEVLAGALKTDYAVFGSLTAMGGSYSLDLALLDRAEAKVTRVTETVSEEQFIPRLAEVAHEFRAAIEGIDIRALRRARLREASPEEQATRGLFFTPNSEGATVTPTGTISLRMTVMAFDMGDLDGDGDPELVILDRKRLLIYKKKEATFVLSDSLVPSLGEGFLKVSIGDGDGNGRPEIYLVSRYGTSARSTVWEWSGKFEKRYTMGGHLQVARNPAGGKPVVLFQDTMVNKFFIGKIWVMDYDNSGKVTRREALSGLEKAQFYTLTFYDLNKDGSPETLGLNENSRLCVWDKEGTIVWRSDNKVGGTNNAIVLKQRDEQTYESLIPFNSRVLITDIDKDGNREVIAIDNEPMMEHMEQFKVYEKSKLVVYKIKGSELVQSLTSMKMNYCVMDMQVDGKTLYLAAQKPKILNIGKGSSRMVWFE